MCALAMVPHIAMFLKHSLNCSQLTNLQVSAEAVSHKLEEMVPLDSDPPLSIYTSRQGNRLAMPVVR